MCFNSEAEIKIPIICGFTADAIKNFLFLKTDSNQ